MKREVKKILIILVILSISFSSCITRALRKSSSSDKFLTYNLSKENIYSSLKWGPEKRSLFLPVKLDNYSDTVYLQLDFGTGVSVFIEKGISIIMQDTSIKNKIITRNGRYYYSNPIIHLNDKEFLSCNYLPINNYTNIEGYKISNDSLAKKYKPTNDNFLIIGTLGYDMIYNRTFVLDFKNNKYCLTENLQDSSITKPEYRVKASVYEWPLIINAKYRNRRRRLIFDTGSSGIGLALFENDWNKSKGEEIDTLYNMMSWGREMFTVEKITFEKLIINNEVYSNFPIITSEIVEKQKFAFRLLRTKGIIGNYLFYDKTIVIDTKNDKLWIKNW